MRSDEIRCRKLLARRCCPILPPLRRICAGDLLALVSLECAIGRKIAEVPWGIYASGLFVERHGKPATPADIVSVIELGEEIQDLPAARWIRARAPKSRVAGRCSNVSSVHWRSSYVRSCRQRDQLPDLVVQPLDLTLAVHPGIAGAAFEGACRLIPELLLPGINLVRMNLITLRQISHRRMLAQRLQRDLRLQRRINFRLVQNFFSYWLLCIFHSALTGRISS